MMCMKYIQININKHHFTTEIRSIHSKGRTLVDKDMRIHDHNRQTVEIGSFW